MKKFIFALCALFLIPMFGFAEVNTLETETSITSASESRGVVFRSTQKLRSSDGRSIYLYSSGRCELFDGDRLVAECTYTLQNGEVRLLDENGRTVYKGTYRMKSDGRNLSSITLAGTTYIWF